MGIAHHLAGVVVDRRLYFVSDADQRKGLFVWDGGARPISLSTPDLSTGHPGLDDTFKGLNQARLKYVSCANLATGDGRAQWWTLASSSAQTVQDRIIIYDYGLNAWTVYKTGADMNVIGQVDVSSINEVFIGYTNGAECQADSGTTDHISLGRHDGANNASVLTDSSASFTASGLIGMTVTNVEDNSSGTITANTATTVTATLSGGGDWDKGDAYHITGPIRTEAVMKTFDFGSQRIKKKMRFVEHVSVGKSAGGAISLDVQSDFGLGPSGSASLNHSVSGSVFVLDTDTLDSTAILGGSLNDVQDRTRLRTVGKYLRPTISSDDDFHLKTIAFGVQPTGRMR